MNVVVLIFGQRLKRGTFAEILHVQEDFKINPEKIELLDYDFIKEGDSRLQVLEL